MEKPDFDSEHCELRLRCINMAIESAIKVRAVLIRRTADKCLPQA